MANKRRGGALRDIITREDAYGDFKPDKTAAQTRAPLGLFMSRAPLRIRGCLVAGERNKLAGLHQSVQCRMYHVFPEDVYA